MSTTRAIVGQATTIRLSTYNDGTLTDQGTVTIGITNAAGSDVVAAGTAVVDNSDGTYDYTLAAQSNVNKLTATWTVAGGATFTTYIDVVGNILFDEVDARAFDNAAMASTSSYGDADILAAERAIADEFETWCKRSYVRRYCRVELPGSSTDTLDLASTPAAFRTADGDEVGGPGRLRDIRKILSATDGGVSISADNIVIDGTKLILKSGTWFGTSKLNPYNCVIEYEYGLGGDNPRGVKRPALWRLREILVPTDINARATSYSDQLGTIRFETPGRNGNVSTIPEVNMWVKSQRQDTLVY